MAPIDEARAALQKLPVEDQLTLLVCSIVAACPNPGNALCVSLRMIRVTALLSRGQSDLSRYKIAERMRNFADELERAEVASIGID